MNIKILGILALSLSSYAYAVQYEVRIPMDSIASQGSGSPQLPEDPKETWIPINPVVGEWTNSGELKNCSWTPLSQDVSTGISFVQTANDCVQEQTQTTQNYEKSSLTSEVRPSGQPIIKSRSNSNVASTQDSKGTRYTHTLLVGSYTSYDTPTQGYFGPDSLATYGSSLVIISSGTFGGGSYKGYTVDYFIKQGDYFSLRLLPLQPSAIKFPVIVIDGVTCTTNSFVVNSVYNSVCPQLNLESKIGQTVQVDMLN